MFNNFTIEVRLGKDAEVHESNGNKFLTMTAAFNQNTKEKETIWFDVLCFNYNEKLVQYYKKGSLLVIHGELTFENKTWKDGSVHETKKITAYKIDFPSNVKNDANDTNATSEPKQQEEGASNNSVSMYASKKKKTEEPVPEPVVTTATAQGGEIDNSDLPF